MEPLGKLSTQVLQRWMPELLDHNWIPAGLPNTPPMNFCSRCKGIREWKEERWQYRNTTEECPVKPVFDLRLAIELLCRIQFATGRSFRIYSSGEGDVEPFVKVEIGAASVRMKLDGRIPEAALLRAIAEAALAFKAAR